MEKQGCVIIFICTKESNCRGRCSLQLYTAEWWRFNGSTLNSAPSADESKQITDAKWISAVEGGKDTSTARTHSPALIDFHNFGARHKPVRAFEWSLKFWIGGGARPSAPSRKKSKLADV
jgi:hypothetical protein